MDRVCQRNPLTSASRRGSMLILIALSLTALIAMMGLVIDGGYLYLVRQKSQAAADAAALAAGKYVGASTVVTTSMLQEATWAANLNNMGGLPATVSVSLNPSNGQVTAINTATVQPLFLSVLGMKAITVTDLAVAQLPGYNLPKYDLSVVVDRSSSFNGNFDAAKNGLIAIINAEFQANPNTQFGLTFFTGSGVTETNFVWLANNYNTLLAMIKNEVDCAQTGVPCGSSDIAAGMSAAVNLFSMPGYSPTPSAAPAVLFISDGAASITSKSMYNKFLYNNILNPSHDQTLADTLDNNLAIALAQNAYSNNGYNNGISVFSMYMENGAYSSVDTNAMKALVSGQGTYTYSNSAASLANGVASYSNGNGVYMRLIQ